MNVFVQFMSGEVHSIRVWNGFTMGNLLDKVHDIIRGESYEEIEFYNKDHELVVFDEEDFIQNGDLFYVVVQAVTKELILNMTEGTYFVYTNGDYTNLLAALFEKQNGESRWNKDDKIIFVPAHLVDYAIYTYENVYP